MKGKEKSHAIGEVVKQSKLVAYADGQWQNITSNFLHENKESNALHNNHYTYLDSVDLPASTLDHMELWLACSLLHVPQDQLVL
jgi:hypothetical protein